MEARTGRYEEVPSIKKKRILDEQDKLFIILQGKTSTSQPSPAQRMAAFNSLEAISATINDRDDERLVCERQKDDGK